MILSHQKITQDLDCAKIYQKYHTMKTELPWVKMSERKPVLEDLPVIIAGPGYYKMLNAMTPSETFHCDATHWKEFRDAPPKEMTQEDKDEELMMAISHAFSQDMNLHGHRDLIATALSFERSEIRQLLKRHQCGELPAPEVIRLISARVKL